MLNASKASLDSTQRSQKVAWGVTVAGAIVVLLPLMIVAGVSFYDAGSTIGSPGHWTFGNYTQAWTQGRLGWAFLNSALVAITVTLLQALTSAMAAYSLARLKFRGRQGLLLLFLATLAIPLQLLVVPIFMVLKWGHLIDTYGALILPTAVNGFGIFLLRQYFSTIPIELEEAAMLDGADRWQVLWQVIFPLAKPAIVALCLFSFVGEWNDVIKPLVFTTRPELQTVQLALTNFQEQFTNDWPLLMAGVTIATIPIVVLFVAAQKQFVRGLATTGTKI
ncbi:MAG: carbohydrate ABC transporter permease [Oscillatoriales cyanobacterium]|jgi:multiple sugar transport system permease protein|nr:MAG: carbohydrate ABC transporter permease [Oscillatoriales cyanobacterium]